MLTSELFIKCKKIYCLLPSMPIMALRRRRRRRRQGLKGVGGVAAGATSPRLPPPWRGTALASHKVHHHHCCCWVQAEEALCCEELFLISHRVKTPMASFIIPNTFSCQCTVTEVPTSSSLLECPGIHFRVSWFKFFLGNFGEHEMFCSFPSFTLMQLHTIRCVLTSTCQIIK